LKDVLRDEYAHAKSAEGQASLARKLQSLAGDTRDDNALRFVMITQALDLAVKSADVNLVTELIDSLCRSYATELWDQRFRIGNQLLHAARTPEGRQNSVRWLRDLAETALREDKYAQAVEMADLAVSLAVTTSDVKLREQTHEFSERAKRLQTASAEVDEAIDRLMTRPSDAEANLIVGRFRCFMKDDWETGLPYLAHGNDPELQELAVLESQHPSTGAEQMRLAEGWFNLAERKLDLKEAYARKPIFNRAVYWYRQAIPNLNGLMALKAQKRIDEAESRTAEPAPPQNRERRTRSVSAT
jgi:hypothetical protein